MAFPVYDSHTRTHTHRDIYGRTPVCIAAIHGCDESLRGLLGYVAGNSVDKSGHTPLHYACYHGHDACVAALLDDDVAWKADNEHPFGPLHCAAYV